MAGTFDGAGQGTLMQRASTGLPSWSDLAVFGYKSAQHISILIIDADILIRAELADLGTRNKPART